MTVGSIGTIEFCTTLKMFSLAGPTVLGIEASGSAWIEPSGNVCAVAIDVLRSPGNATQHHIESGDLFELIAATVEHDYADEIEAIIAAREPADPVRNISEYI